MKNILIRQSTVLFLLLVSAGTGVVSAQSTEDSRDRELSVMTRNMYLGTDFGEIFAAQTPEELVAEVAEALILRP